MTNVRLITNIKTTFVFLKNAVWQFSARLQQDGLGFWSGIPDFARSGPVQRPSFVV